MLTNDEITTKIESAFSPLRCVAQIWDYEFRLRFKVFDGNKGIVEMPNIRLEDAQDEDQLKFMLQHAREIIERKGYQLN